MLYEDEAAGKTKDGRRVGVALLPTSKYDGVALVYS